MSIRKNSVNSNETSWSSHRKRNDYVSNAELLSALLEHGRNVKEATARKAEKPRVPTYVAECIIKIATRLAYRPNFKNYTFRDEMISDGIENAFTAVKTFDPAKSQNPFAYFTQIIWWAFVRRIHTEKKYLYTKYAASRQAELLDMMSDSQVGDEERYGGTLAYGEWSQEQMNKFMEDFEQRLRDKKKERIDKPKKSV